MTIGYTEKKNIEESIELDEEKILNLLESYPGAAILLSLREKCIDSLLSRLQDIMEEYREMKETLSSIKELVDDNQTKIPQNKSVEIINIIEDRVGNSSSLRSEGGRDWASD